jgi:hypothetical protein
MATKSNPTSLQTPVFKRTKQGSSDALSWKQLFHHCLSHRLRKQDFERLANQLHCRLPLAGQELVDILLNCQDGAGPVADPLLSIYLESLLLSEVINAAHLLDGLYVDSRYCPHPTMALDETVQRKKARRMSNDLDSTIFMILCRHFLSGKLPSVPEEARELLRSLSKWMLAVTSFYVSLLQVLDQDAIATCDALGLFAVCVLENIRMIGLIDHACSKGPKS